MRLIDADTTWNALERAEWYNNADRDIAENLVLNAPTVDAAPVVHGRWDLVDREEPQRYGCSKCSCLSWYGTYRYCPNCGARMDLEEQDADRS